MVRRLTRANGFRDLEHFHHFPNIPTLNTSCMPLRLCQASYHMAYIPGVWTLEESDHFAGLGKMEAAGHWSPLAETHVRDSWWYCTLVYLGNFWELLDGIWHFVEGTTFQNPCLCFLVPEISADISAGRCLGLQPFSTFELLWMGLWAGDHCLGPWFPALVVTRTLQRNRLSPASTLRNRPSWRLLLWTDLLGYMLKPEMWSWKIAVNSNQDPLWYTAALMWNLQTSGFAWKYSDSKGSGVCSCVPPNQMPADYKLNF